MVAPNPLISTPMAQAIANAITDNDTTDSSLYPLVTSGSGAPGSTPTKIGDLYVATTGPVLYIAKGLASSADWVISNVSQFPAIVSGSGAPGSTPVKIGNIYVDTTGSKAYISKGTTNSSDWMILN